MIVMYSFIRSYLFHGAIEDCAAEEIFMRHDILKDMYIVHLKPDQTKSVPERINEWGVGPQNGHQELYITSHQPTTGEIYGF